MLWILCPDFLLKVKKKWPCFQIVDKSNYKNYASLSEASCVNGVKCGDNITGNVINKFYELDESISR